MYCANGQSIVERFHHSGTSIILKPNEIPVHPSPSSDDQKKDTADTKRKKSWPLITMVLEKGEQHISVRDFPDRFASAMYPELPNTTPLRVVELRKTSTKETINQALRRRRSVGLIELSEGSAEDGYWHFMSDTGSEIAGRSGGARKEKRKAVDTRLDNLAPNYVRDREDKPLPLTEDDKKALSEIWGNLPPLSLPKDEPAVRSYLEALYACPDTAWRKKWRLCVKFVDPFAERDRLWDSAVRECKDILRRAVDKGHVTLRSPRSRLAVASARADEGTDYFLTLDDIENGFAEQACVRVDFRKASSNDDKDAMPRDGAAEHLDWRVKAKSVADRIALELWKNGIRAISARAIHEKVAAELEKDATSFTMTGVPRAAEAVRVQGLRGWKFKRPMDDVLTWNMDKLDIDRK